MLHSLFDTMRSVVTEANALVEEAEVLVHANKPSEYVDEWWQNACRNWSDAFTDFKITSNPKGMRWRKYFRWREESEGCGWQR